MYKSYQKYQVEDIILSVDKRKEYNEKLLTLIDLGKVSEYGVKPEEIASLYSGDGGTTGLNFNDFNNFHAYTEAKKEIEQGQFFTPYSIAKFMLDCLRLTSTDLICDLTSGVGRFFNYCPVEHNCYSNELDIKAYKIQKYLYPNVNIENNDVRFYNPEVTFDYMILNPPFNLKFVVGKEEMLSQFYILTKAYQLLKPTGICAMIIPNSFLADDFKDSGYIKQVNNQFNFICQFDLPKDAFKNVGVDNFETKIIIFQKQSENIENKPYSLDKIQINGLNETTSEYIYNTYIKPLQETKESLKSKLLLENLKGNEQTQENKEFEFKVKKMLFDIGRNKYAKNYYGKCQEIVHKYYNQSPPKNCTNEEYKNWYNHKRITKKKVFAYFKEVWKKVNTFEKDEIKLVKTAYGLKLKAYSRKSKLQLNKILNTKEMSFNDMIINNDYPFEDKTYKKLWLRKVKEYHKQTKSFKEMQENNEINNFLESSSIYDYTNENEIKLTIVQKEVLNKLLQKKYSACNLECGTGKSVICLFASKYRLEMNQIDYSFIVAPAIAINNTFEQILQDYKMNFIRINKLADINKIQKGQIIIITFNQLIKYERQLNKFMKQHHKRVMINIDEADNIVNFSKRSKATKNVFKYAKYKMLYSGTLTRNNINESFNEFNFLYGSSLLFVNHCNTILETDKKTGEANEKNNPYYMKPFPEYKKGYNNFSASFQPFKTTVFGLSKYNQDIHHADQLKEIIDRTIITKTFYEVCQKDIYEINQETCNFTQSEKELYIDIIEKFYEMKNNYFNCIANSRKDRMFDILRQLNLLIKACSIPHTFKEYKGNDVSSKFKKCAKLVEKYNERICIGCKYIKTVENLYAYLRSKNPDRPIFIITGQSTTLKQRLKIVKQLKETTNGILLCTKGALSSSMNIDFVNKVISMEMEWTFAVEKQWFMRFCRMTSTEYKNIIYLSYAKSIESNLLQLLVSKEKLNCFLKDREVDNEQLWDEMGIDFDILDMLMYKETNEDGKMNIRTNWGEQQIV